GIIEGVKVVLEANKLSEIKKQIYSKIKSKYSIENIKETPVVNAYRKFYWQFLNIDPTKTRPSGEALVRRVLKNQKIPIINNIVYSINLASIETQLSFSGFDLNKIEPPLIIRYAFPNEAFQGLGTRHKILTGNELLLADTKKILCIYAYGDADMTKITTKTKNILLINYGVPNIADIILEEGIKIGLKYIQEAGGGEIKEVKVTKPAHPEPSQLPLEKQ
ncbi:MAG: B3/B4 domain-containing protein, partial [Candidatus Helarchaeota archaeon]